MISAKTKKELLKEVEKNGNVSLSCAKIGIDKSIFYRWKEKNPEFWELAEAAIERGRKTNCDVAESSLMVLVKQKNLAAIKYLLSHNSPRYKTRKDEHKDKHIVIEHRVTGKTEKNKADIEEVEKLKVVIVTAREELEDLQKLKEEKNNFLIAENSNNAERGKKPSENNLPDTQPKAKASAPPETEKKDAEKKNNLPMPEAKNLSK